MCQSCYPHGRWFGASRFERGHTLVTLGVIVLQADLELDGLQEVALLGVVAVVEELSDILTHTGCTENCQFFVLSIESARESPLGSLSAYRRRSWTFCRLPVDISSIGEVFASLLMFGCSRKGIWGKCSKEFFVCASCGGVGFGPTFVRFRWFWTFWLTAGFHHKPGAGPCTVTVLCQDPCSPFTSTLELDQNLT